MIKIPQEALERENHYCVYDSREGISSVAKRVKVPFLWRSYDHNCVI